MNVLFIGTTDILGGAAKVSWEIKTALEAHGDTVSMFVADKRSDDSAVHVIPRQKWRKYLSLLLASENCESTNWILDTPEFKAADIIHCHNLHGRYFNLSTLVKMSQLKPVIWTLHDEWALTPHCAYTLEGIEMKAGLYVCPSLDTQPRLLWDNTKRLAARRAKIYQQAKLYIVTPSQWLAHRVAKTILQTQPHVLIPNGIDTNIFVQTDKAEARRQLNLPLNKKIVLFLATAGKANTWKGWKHVEQVMNGYKNQNDVLFLNVGNLSPEANEKNIEYRAHVTSECELALYYSAADVLLFTSIAENFPLVILEAMSCGLPIVSFDVGGVKEVVTHKENGFIVDYGDTSSLSFGLDWLFNLSEAEKVALSQHSIQKIKGGYDTAHMVQNYLTHYQSILHI